MASAAYCRKCGAPLEASDRFCEKCGAEVASAPPPAAAVPPPPPAAGPPPPPAATATPPAPYAAPPTYAAPPAPPSAVVAYPWYLRPSAWVGILLLVFLVIGLVVMVRGHAAKPDTKALASGEAPIGGDLPAAPKDSKSESNDPIRDSLEKSGKLDAKADASDLDPAAGVKPFLGRWKITEGETDLKPDQRILEFVRQGDQVVAEVPPLSAKFELIFDSTTGNLTGTFSNATKSVPATVEYDATKKCLHISIRPENGEPLRMTAVPAD
jgi:hypothetical protein